MDEQAVELVMNQMVDLQSQHPGLELVLCPSGRLQVRGSVGFRIEHDTRIVEDTYEVELHIPDDFPNSPPTAYEIGHKIPEDFEHFMEAGNFCLGAPVEVRRRFLQHRNLQRFVDDQVIPYLFSYSYRRDYGRLPFGELRHGFIGLLDYYTDHFGNGSITTLKLLKLLADNFAPPAGSCPCGSGSKLRDCHGPKLDELRPHYRPELFEAELLELIKMAQIAKVRLPERHVMPKRMWKQKQRRRNKKKKQNPR